VDHVFCATDLNRSIPFFFFNSRWGQTLLRRYGLAAAPNVPVNVAVRASAAFPPFIPPLRFYSSAQWTGFEIPVPTKLWLTDGGVFNNLGTDWHLRRQDLSLLESELEREHLRLSDTPLKEAGDTAHTALPTRYGQVQLVIDASQIAPPKKLLHQHIPVLGFFSYLLRTNDIMYGSTLAGRTEGAENQVKLRMAEANDKWRSYGRRMHHWDKDTFDIEGRTYGALKIFVPYSLSLLELFRKWVGAADIAHADAFIAFRGELERAPQLLGTLWPREEFVPTTFRSLGHRRTLRTVVRGYLATRTALTATFAISPPPIPPAAWFEELLSDPP
jgi:hypothetical protein